jgi:hypothetical protein
VAFKQAYFCDVCAAMKASSNHWLQAWKSATGDLAVGHWFEEAATLEKTIHLCSMTCYQKLLSEHLEMTKPRMEVTA